MSNEEILDETENLEGDYGNDDLDEFVDWADAVI